MVVELIVKDAKPVTTVQVCIATKKIYIFLTGSGTSAATCVATKTGTLSKNLVFSHLLLSCCCAQI